jgi:hypothetical protein
VLLLLLVVSGIVITNVGAAFIAAVLCLSAWMECHTVGSNKIYLLSVFSFCCLLLVLLLFLLLTMTIKRKILLELAIACCPSCWMTIVVAGAVVSVCLDGMECILYLTSWMT